MSVIGSVSFPNEVWHGLSKNPSRTDRHGNIDPDWRDWHRIVNEVIATQIYVLDMRGKVPEHSHNEYLPVDGSKSLEADLDAGKNQIKNLEDPTDERDSVTKGYCELSSQLFTQYGLVKDISASEFDSSFNLDPEEATFFHIETKSKKVSIGLQPGMHSQIVTIRLSARQNTYESVFWEPNIIFPANVKRERIEKGGKDIVVVAFDKNTNKWDVINYHKLPGIE